MLVAKRIEPDVRALPGDVCLGLLHLEGVAKAAYAMALISSLHDRGPNELMVLSNQDKINAIFSQGITSFIDLLEENYHDNRFFVFKSSPQPVALNSISTLAESPITEYGQYVAFWGVELPTGTKKNSWPMSIYERRGKEVIGNFVAIDIIKENGMLDMLYKIKRDGRK